VIQTNVETENHIESRFVGTDNWQIFYLHIQKKNFFLSNLDASQISSLSLGKSKQRECQLMGTNLNPQNSNLILTWRPDCHGGKD